MTNEAPSASLRETNRQPSQFPCLTSSHMAVSSGMPIDGSAVTTIATGPNVQSFAAAR